MSRSCCTLSFGVTQEGPRGAQRVAELVEVEWVVRADDDEPRICDAELWITVHQIPEKTMLFRVIRPSGQMEDHRVATLELRQLSQRSSLVLELVVRKGGSDFDVFSHFCLSGRIVGAGAKSAKRSVPADQ